MILDTLQETSQPLTRTEIAEALNRKKTPFLTELIDGMVTEGSLQRRVVTFHNGVQGYVYTLPQEVKG